METLTTVTGVLGLVGVAGVRAARAWMCARTRLTALRLDPAHVAARQDATLSGGLVTYERDWRAAATDPNQNMASWTRHVQEAAEEAIERLPSRRPSDRFEILNSVLSHLATCTRAAREAAAAAPAERPHSPVDREPVQSLSNQ